MNTKQAREENRIRDALSAFNPLNNEDFCDEIRRSYLLYGDDKQPRKVANNRMIAGIWREASEDDAFVTRTARKWHRSEPIFNAILAEAWATIEHDQEPDIPGASDFARRVMLNLLRKRVQDTGLQETMAELRREFLLAVEQMAKSGFTGDSIFMLAYIAGLGHLARGVSQAI